MTKRKPKKKVRPSRALPPSITEMALAGLFIGVSALFEVGRRDRQITSILIPGTVKVVLSVSQVSSIVKVLQGSRSCPEISEILRSAAFSAGYRINCDGIILG